MIRRKSASFNDRWVAVPESGCWLWTGTQDVNGYGEIRDKVTRKKHRAHRVSWERANGAIPDGLYVLHKCDVKACVNPQHLFLGTHADNMADWVSKGSRGAANNSKKLTYSEAQAIAKSSDSASVLSEKHGISRWAISAIRSGRVWAKERTYPRGEDCPAAKLTTEQAARIIVDRRADRKVAADYGISKSLVHAIRSRRAWKHVAPIYPNGQQPTTESVNVP